MGCVVVTIINSSRVGFARGGNVTNMLLAIDVGNTQTVLGVYDGKRLLHQWRIATMKHHTSDELRVKLKPLFDSEGIVARCIDGAALASVVPCLTDAWRAAIRHMIGVSAVVCSAETAAGLFEADYPNPREIGADRVADAVAARSRFGSPVVVVDFGTATNIEVIDVRGCFIGGVIAPGIETSAQALFSHATKLGAIDLVDPHAAIGRNTEQAMQAGIVYGEVDRVDGLVRRIFRQLGYEAPVVATGGLATRVAKESGTITAIMPDLTLEGLRLVYETQADSPAELQTESQTRA